MVTMVCRSGVTARSSRENTAWSLDERLRTGGRLRLPIRFVRPHLIEREPGRVEAAQIDARLEETAHGGGAGAPV